MAAKAPVAKAAAKGTVAKQPTKVKAPAKGLQLTTSQWAAYNKAYSATATATRKRLAIASMATGYRKYRLQAANATVKKYQASRASAQAAAVAAYATRMTFNQSRLAHQNAALQHRIELDMYSHANLAGRLQYAQAGVKAYAHSAVMRTVDTAQATAYESQVYAKLLKTARKASKSTTTKYKGGSNSKVITAAAQAAGLAAAAATPAGSGPKGTSSSSVKAKATASKTAKATAAKTVKAKAQAAASANKSSASAKAPAVTPKGRTAPMTPYGGMAGVSAAYTEYQKQEENKKNPAWLGDETTPNCVVTAIANHLLHAKGTHVPEAALRELAGAVSDNPAIEEVLWAAYLMGWPCNRKVRLGGYKQVFTSLDDPLLVIGYATEHGDHAALALEDGEVVSWGSVTKRENPVEEAWELTWES